MTSSYVALKFIQQIILFGYRKIYKLFHAFLFTQNNKKAYRWEFFLQETSLTLNFRSYIIHDCHLLTA